MGRKRKEEGKNLEDILIMDISTYPQTHHSDPLEYCQILQAITVAKMCPYSDHLQAYYNDSIWSSCSSP